MLLFTILICSRYAAAKENKFKMSIQDFRFEYVEYNITKEGKEERNVHGSEGEVYEQ